MKSNSKPRNKINFVKTRTAIEIVLLDRFSNTSSLIFYNGFKYDYTCILSNEISKIDNF